MSARTFIIGDIHGCSKTFDALLYDKLKINAEDNIYLLGDYIDRGPDSKGVLDRIISLMDSGYNVFPIMGNHEQMLLDAFSSSEKLKLWISNGARSALKSFSIEHIRELDSKYVDFVINLKYFYQLPGYILVHGGLNFAIQDPICDLQAMVWTRNEYVFKDKIGGKRLIVGHTPTPLKTIIESLQSDKIMLDGGCVYLKMYPRMGNLCALELETMRLESQVNIDV